VAQAVLDVVKAEGKGSWGTFEAEQDAYSERSASIVSTARSEWQVAITQLKSRP
jgi:hypothetical protein